MNFTKMYTKIWWKQLHEDFGAHANSYNIDLLTHL